MNKAHAGILRRLIVLFLLVYTILPGASALAAAKPTATPDPDRFVDPTYPPNVAKWDSSHPDLLEPEMVLAEAAILVEMDTGTVIFAKNEDRILYPASTTKILTALLGIQFGDLEEEVEITEEALDIPEDSSKIGLRAGEMIKLKDLIYGTMVKSGNDGAKAIAVHISGSEEEFVNLMNQTASMLGCSENTHFANSHGYHDENHYTTVRDMAIIARAAMQVDTFRDVASSYKYTIPATNLQAARNLQSDSMNFMSPTQNDGEPNSYYYNGGIGVKTGFHSKAGYCYVGAAYRDGVELLSVVFNTSRRGRWNDTRMLMDYGFSQYISTNPVSIYEEDPRYIDIAGFALDDYYNDEEKYGTVKLGIRPMDEENEVHVVGTRDEIETMKNNFSSISHVNWTREFRAPIYEGDVMGVLTFYPRDGDPVDYELYATRSVAARLDGPLTLEEIERYTLEDENPLPRFSLEYVTVPAVFLIILILFIRRLRSLRKKKKARDVRVPEPKSRSYR